MIVGRTTQVMAYRTIPYHAIPYHTIPYHTIPYHAIPYHTIPYHTIPYHTIPYHTIPYHTIPYHTIPYHTISYHGIRHSPSTVSRACLRPASSSSACSAATRWSALVARDAASRWELSVDSSCIMRNSVSAQYQTERNRLHPYYMVRNVLLGGQGHQAKSKVPYQTTLFVLIKQILFVLIKQIQIQRTLFFNA